MHMQEDQKTRNCCTGHEQVLPDVVTTSQTRSVDEHVQAKLHKIEVSNRLFHRYTLKPCLFTQLIGVCCTLARYSILETPFSCRVHVCVLCVPYA